MANSQFLNKLLEAAAPRRISIVELAAESKTKPGTIRRVRTKEGALYYSVPVGTPITAARATREAIKASKDETEKPPGSDKPPTVTVSGVKQSYPVGSVVYHGKRYDADNAPEKYIRTPDGTWYHQSTNGIVKMGPKVGGAFDYTVDTTTPGSSLVRDESPDESPEISDYLPPNSPDDPNLPDVEENALAAPANGAAQDIV